MRAWNTTSEQMENKLYTGRKIPNVLVIAKLTYTSEKPVAEELEPVVTPIVIPVAEEKEEEEPMAETPTPIETEPVQDWKDPEPTAGATLLARVAALLSVKSIITIFLTAIFGMLVLKGEELPDKFVSIYTMCISFFFGYQFKKAENKE